MELDNQFRLFSFRPAPQGDMTNGPNIFFIWFRDPLNRPLTTNTLPIPRPPGTYGAEGQHKVFICPSAPPWDPSSTAIQAVNGPGASNVDFNSAWGGSGTFWFSTQPGAQIMGRTNYLASAGDPRRRNDRTSTTTPPNTVDAHGLFYYESKESVRNVPDGTSNTLMFVENAGAMFSTTADPLFTPRMWTQNTWAWGVWYSAYGVCPNQNTPNGPGQNCSTASDGLGMSLFTAGSLHAGNICMSAMADGSVKGMNFKTIDSLSLAYLAGAKDGMVQGTDF